MDASGEARDGTDEDARGFAYFVIRVRKDADAPLGEPRGTIERLGSGRAHAFNGARELLEMLVDPSRYGNHR
jgi:hypothetical protein